MTLGTRLAFALPKGRDNSQFEVVLGMATHLSKIFCLCENLNYIACAYVFCFMKLCQELIDRHELKYVFHLQIVYEL